MLSARLHHNFLSRFQIRYEALNLNRLQYFIDSGRIDPSKPINMRTLCSSGAVGRIEHGVKLLADVSLSKIRYYLHMLKFGLVMQYLVLIGHFLLFRCLQAECPPVGVLVFMCESLDHSCNTRTHMFTLTTNTYAGS